MLLKYLYNLYIFIKLDFIQLQLIYIKNKLVIGIHSIYPLDMLNICLQYIGFRNYLYTINPSYKWDKHL